MAGVNKIILVGNLGKDPELKTLENDNALCKFSVATPRFKKDSQGNKQEHADWHNVVTWGKQAENCAKYLGKGSQVYVEGRFENREYHDKDGIKKYFPQVHAYSVQFLSGKQDGEVTAGAQQRTALVHDGVTEEELPF